MLRAGALIALCIFALHSPIAAQGTGRITTPLENRFDSVLNAEPVIIGSITISGNKVTKERIIQRELPFRVHDTIAPGELGKALSRAKQNLQNTHLFNFVTITHENVGNKVAVQIELIERWYLWPVPFFELAETNFNTWWLTKDFTRANYGLFFTRENFRGRKEAVRFKVQLGYTHQFALQYNVPYIDRKQVIGLGITFSYYTNKEINIGTVNNKRVFFRNSNDYVREEYLGRVNMSIRHSLYNHSSLQLRYQQAEIADSLASITSDYFNPGERETKFLMLGYYFRRDRRDYTGYPLNGYLVDAEINRWGLGYFKSSPSLFTLYSSFRKYFKLTEHLYESFQVKGKLSSERQQPYYLQRGLGYGNDLVRGYGYYVMDGQHWALFKNNFKVRLIKPHVKKLFQRKGERFGTFYYALYLNFFADAGYVSDKLYAQQNPLSNTFLLGYGAGLDFITYYDFVVRAEYAFNKLGESGFFLNFAAAF